VEEDREEEMFPVKVKKHISFFFHGTTAPSGPGPPHYKSFMVTLRHTKLDRITLDG